MDWRKFIWWEYWEVVLEHGLSVRDRDTVPAPSLRSRRGWPPLNRRIWSAALAAFSCLAMGATAAPPVPAARQTETELQSVTVEAQRDRAVLERRVKTFVSSITTAPIQESLAQWQKEMPICPEVAGLPLDDGEYVLSRLSEIAGAAGASLAPEICSPNLHIIVSSVPDEIIEEWSKRYPWMFGTAGGTKIRQFLKGSAPIRVWYNTKFFTGEGIPCKTYDGGIEVCEQDAEIAHIRFAALRDLSSVIVLVDARQTKGVNISQLAAYIAMVGLAEIRVNPKLGDAPTILRLFTDFANAPPLGLSAWDAAYLKALYHTPHDDRTQLSILKATMLNEVAPPPGYDNNRK
jgi:hypothetical protein